MILNLSIDQWLGCVHSFCIENAPELLPLLAIHSEEAKFAHNQISSDLSILKPGSKILEVGAGTLLLSCQLQREGFQVTALEPTGVGFSHFDRLRKIVLLCSKINGNTPEVIRISVEDLKIQHKFDYAFSINVMEHVRSVSSSILNVFDSLIEKGCYRFTCPNYLFPYEPHFNIPTLFFKKITELVFHKKIFQSERVHDALGTWQSLNWINYIQVSIISRRIKSAQVKFNSEYMIKIIERISYDKNFSQRRSPLVCYFLMKLLRLNVHGYIKYIPIIFQPVIDCHIIKNQKSK